ncbi:MAG: 50S ribosomal protein L29 [Phycisphaeraceae bacterium]|nr:50S ribosomal protein L29 [Phycisphaerales bacterium]QOJ17687.1 MAG: 50S ribosomal protein L29 [Phycisphaeraceae bacterium]
MAKKAKNIRKMSDEDLILEVTDARKRLFDLRSQAVTEKIEDTSQFGKIRKHMARLLTEHSARKRAKAGMTS